jgi:hypothetical protein
MRPNLAEEDKKTIIKRKKLLPLDLYPVPGKKCYLDRGVSYEKTILKALWLMF